MSFAAPYLLWGALAAAIPIILHFFYRSRYRTVPWGAMKFLLAAVEQTSRRLRFQELLLLALRVALLLLLALALARPSTKSSGTGAGDAVDAVLVVDASMSMAARAGLAPAGQGNDPFAVALRSFATRDGSVRAFDRARASAIAILGSLPPHSTVQLISCTDRAEHLGPQSPSHLDQARTLLEEMSLTEVGTDLLPAVELAADLLAKGPSPNKELYLIGDMQRRGWQTRESALTARLAELKDQATIHLVHVSKGTPANVTLTGVTPQSTLRPGERADFAVLVRNTGKTPVQNLTVTLEIDGGPVRESQPLARIEPGTTQAVVLSGVIDRPGKHLLTATVAADDLEGDNRLDQIIQVADRLGVLVVDGAPDFRDARQSASYFLQHALDPLVPGAPAGLPITSVAADRAAPRDLGGKELCILVNARLPGGDKQGEGGLSDEFVRALVPFVQEGRSLVIVPGDRVEPADYTQMLHDQFRLLPARISKVEATAEKSPWTLDRASADSQPFARFRNEQGYAGIDRIEVRRRLALTLDPADGSRVLLRYRDGQPAIVSRQRPGQGEVVLFGTSVGDPQWSDWFISPAFVPFVQVLVNHLLDGRPEAFNRIAGEPLIWPVSQAEAEQVFDLIGPDGKRKRLGYPASETGRPLLTATGLARAGLYRIVPGGREPGEDTPLFAVAPDIRETEELDLLGPADIDAMLGFKVTHLTPGEDGSVFSPSERIKSEWTRWLLWGLLALVLGEMLLAWHCGRSPGMSPELKDFGGRTS